MGDTYDHTQNRGWRQPGKYCPYCKCTDLIFINKFYVKCRKCRKIISRSVLRRQ